MLFFSNPREDLSKQIQSERIGDKMIHIIFCGKMNIFTLK